MYWQKDLIVKIYTNYSDGKLVIKKLYVDPFLYMFNEEVLSFSISDKLNFKLINDAQKKQ